MEQEFSLNTNHKKAIKLRPRRFRGIDFKIQKSLESPLAKSVRGLSSENSKEKTSFENLDKHHK
jgi:hypothetical protein